MKNYAGPLLLAFIVVVAIALVRRVVQDARRREWRHRLLEVLRLALQRGEGFAPALAPTPRWQSVAQKLDAGEPIDTALQGHLSPSQCRAIRATSDEAELQSVLERLDGAERMPASEARTTAVMLALYVAIISILQAFVSTTWITVRAVRGNNPIGLRESSSGGSLLSSPMTDPLFVATLAIAIVILLREELPGPVARIRRALVENTPLQRFAVHGQLASGFRLLASKLSTGTAPDVALAATANALTSQRASRIFAHASIAVADGRSLDDCWQDAPSRLRRRLEAPRTLTPDRIDGIAQSLDRDHERAWQRMARVAGPLALLAIGFAVASSMASILDTWYAIMNQAIDSSTNPMARPGR
ncbi:MAG: hypothetical protein H6833_12590 [Planctomycetes bacterium]|nr:hypothetical protein [Planctomycetota bacterium]